MGAPARNRLYAAAHHSALTAGFDLGLYPYIKSWLYAPAMEAEIRDASDSGSGASGSGGHLPAGLSRADLEPLDLVSRLQWIDTMAYLPDDILTKVDRASMATPSRRGRRCSTTPSSSSWLASRGRSSCGTESRSISCGACSPDGCPSRSSRSGNEVRRPEGEWFRKDLRGIARAAARFAGAGTRLLPPRAHSRSARTSRRRSQDYSDWIWCLLILEEWHRAFLDPATRRI